jgi:filamentous hemagglutinin
LSKSDPNEERKWVEGGIYRIGAHAALGAIGGGLDGALGNASSAAAAPLIGAVIDAANFPEVARAIAITVAGTAVGSLAGGAAGAVTGADQIANNYLRQHGVGIKKSEQEQFNYAVTACNNGDQSACDHRDSLITLSKQRDLLITNVCATGPSAQCTALVSAALSDGNKTIFGSAGRAVVYPIGSPEIQATPNVRDGTWDDQLAKGMLDGVLMASGDAAVAKLLGVVGKGVAAAADVASGLRLGSRVSVDIANDALARSLNNFYRDGASPEIIQQTFNQAAVSSTHNASAAEVVLGKYLKDSAESYDAVVKSRGATYFSMSDWSAVEEYLGANQMWNINKAFLDQQIAQGKTFLFTGNPAATSAGYYTKLEFQHLIDNGYKIVSEGGMYRAVKK